MSATSSPSAEPSSSSLASKLETKKHVSFLLRCLRLLPQPYTSADDQRMTLGYFAIAGLDLLNATDKIPADEKEELIKWVYAQQSPQGGFRGSASSPSSPANVAMTYSALLILAMLRDDFRRLHREGLLRFVGALQDKSKEGGGFAAEEDASGKGLVDRDPRFTYCAVAICSMLNEWRSIDVEKAREYVKRCQRYDGGFGASDAHESHSGMTYCCVAALQLLPSASLSSRSVWGRKEEAISWIAHRQVNLSPAPASTSSSTLPSSQENKTLQSDDSDSEDEEEVELAGGFQGRPSKLPPDICYSFWNGAALTLLDQHTLIDAEKDAGYVLSAQSRVGGLSKVPGDHPDLLHTYLGLASLSLHQAQQEEEEGDEGDGPGIEFGLKKLDAAYNCTLEAKEWIRTKLTQ